MGKYLVTFNDVVDDIEISGFSLMNEKEINIFEDLAESITWDFSYPLLNDINLEYSSGEDFLTRLEFREISNDEYKTLSKVFNEPFGTFIGEAYLRSLLNDEDSYTDGLDDESDDWGYYRSDDSFSDEHEDNYP